jgi:hypothetical protein
MLFRDKNFGKNNKEEKKFLAISRKKNFGENSKEEIFRRILGRKL